MRAEAPKMTRQHFEFIAQTIANANASDLAKREMANAFAISLGRTNPNFDSGKFRSYADKLILESHDA